MLKKTMLFAGLAAAMSMPAYADKGDIAAGLVAGTAGLGAEVTYGLTKELNLRGTLRGASLNYNYTEDNIDYDGKLKIQNGGLILDWLPFSGTTFRLSAGAMYNGNKITGKALPNGGDMVYTVNDVEYLVDGQVNSNIDWRKFAPYVGVGFGNPVGRGSNWGFTFDVGVMITGAPRADLSASGRYSDDYGTTWNDINLNDPNSPFAQDLQAEKARLNDEISSVKLWPVVQLGLHYKF